MKIDDTLKAEVIKWSAFYEHRIRLGSVSLLKATGLSELLITHKLETYIPSRSVRCQIHENFGEVSQSDDPGHANRTN